MERRNDVPIPKEGEVRDLFSIEQIGKRPYLAPKMKLTLVELENNIAAGSITVQENNGIVEESWIVEEDDVREIDLDFFD